MLVQLSSILSLATITVTTSIETSLVHQTLTVMNCITFLFVIYLTTKSRNIKIEHFVLHLGLRDVGTSLHFAGFNSSSLGGLGGVSQTFDGNFNGFFGSSENGIFFLKNKCISSYIVLFMVQLGAAMNVAYAIVFFFFSDFDNFGSLGSNPFLSNGVFGSGLNNQEAGVHFNPTGFAGAFPTDSFNK